jgi:HSP90 family molecular chaperone
MNHQVDVWGWHRVNNNVAIWSRENKDITEEEYQKFYKAISKETTDAQSWIHFKAEGEVSSRLRPVRVKLLTESHATLLEIVKCWK